MFNKSKLPVESNFAC